MTIWLLALILIGSLVAIGYTQGAIRVGISFIGIIISALLAGPVAKLVKPVLAALGVSNPILLWALGPFIVFVLVLSVFKVIALAAHKKVDVYYKYKAGDLRLALFERLNARLGACLGALNALAYLVLISWVTYAFSYWTTPMSSGDGDPKTVRLLNRMGRDLQSTGMARAARAIDPLPSVFYEAADFAGRLYQNPLAEARLSRYPAFLTLADRPEFQALAQDQALSEMRIGRAPLRQVLASPSVQAITQNPEMLKLVWGIVVPDLKDLGDFLETGRSARYDEKILGRWKFDVNSAMMAYRKARPNLLSTEMQRTKRWMTEAFSKTMLVAAPDGSVTIKNLPSLTNQAATEVQNLQGTWKASGSRSSLSLGSLGERTGKMETGRLVLSGEGIALVFIPED